MKKSYLKPITLSTSIYSDALLVTLSGKPKDDVIAGARNYYPVEEESITERYRRSVWDDDEQEEVE